MGGGRVTLIRDVHRSLQLQSEYSLFNSKIVWKHKYQNQNWGTQILTIDRAREQLSAGLQPHQGVAGDQLQLQLRQPHQVMLNTGFWLVNWPQYWPLIGQLTTIVLYDWSRRLHSPPPGLVTKPGPGTTASGHRWAACWASPFRHGLEPLMCRLIWFMIWT